MKKYEKLYKKFKIDTEYEIIHYSKGFKPLCFVQDKILVFKKGRFFLLNTTDFSYEYVCSFDNSLLNRVLLHSRLLTRLLRLEPRVAVEIDNKKVILSFKGYLYLLDLTKKTITKIHKFREGMNNPLNMCKIKNMDNFDDMICYGEYFSNSSKEEVNIYCSAMGNLEWKKIYTFPKGQINHIHSIVPDYYRNKVWILTGDFEGGAGIWYTNDNFKTVNKFLVGKQKYRSCAVFPIPQGLIYATDTPLAENNIFMLNLEKNKYEIKKLYDLEGSCIYSTKIGKAMVFSTAVEGDSSLDLGIFNLISYRRGKGIKSWNSELVVGNYFDGFERIALFKKDILPMGLFQYGTVVFPYDNNSNKDIILYGYALKDIDGKMLVLRKKNER